MKVIVQFTDRQEDQALPILLRHEPGMMLPERTYVLSENTVAELRKAGIGFKEISREGLAPSTGGGISGERI